MSVRMITAEASNKAHDHPLKTDSNEVVIGAITIRMMQGLLFLTSPNVVEVVSKRTQKCRA